MLSGSLTQTRRYLPSPQDMLLPQTAIADRQALPTERRRAPSAVPNRWVSRPLFDTTAAWEIHRCALDDEPIRLLPAEFALTQVLDRPVQGRALFEDVIRENPRISTWAAPIRCS